MKKKSRKRSKPSPLSDYKGSPLSNYKFYKGSPFSDYKFYRGSPFSDYKFYRGSPLSDYKIYRGSPFSDYKFERRSPLSNYKIERRSLSDYKIVPSLKSKGSPMSNYKITSPFEGYYEGIKLDEAPLEIIEYIMQEMDYDTLKNFCISNRTINYVCKSNWGKKLMKQKYIESSIKSLPVLNNWYGDVNTSCIKRWMNPVVQVLVYDKNTKIGVGVTDRKDLYVASNTVIMTILVTKYNPKTGVFTALGGDDFVLGSKLEDGFKFPKNFVEPDYDPNRRERINFMVNMNKQAMKKSTKEFFKLLKNPNTYQKPNEQIYPFQR